MKNKSKPCSRCKGKGFEFKKDDNIFTGKIKRIFGFEYPEITSGAVQVTCGTCYGKGVR